MFDFWSSVVGGREDGGEQLSLSWEAGQCPRRVTPLSLPAKLHRAGSFHLSLELFLRRSS